SPQALPPVGPAQLTATAGERLARGSASRPHIASPRADESRLRQGMPSYRMSESAHPDIIAPDCQGQQQRQEFYEKPCTGGGRIGTPVHGRRLFGFVEVARVAG